MSTVGYLSLSDVTLVGAAVIIIVFAIIITAAVEASNIIPNETFSKIKTYGPVWRGDTWICTSTEEFLVHGVLVAYANNVGLTIAISGKGSQPDFRFDRNEMKTFTIGGPADSSIRISRSLGTLSGFLTLQTESGARANCTQP